MKIKVWRDPYDCGVNITRKREIDFPTGLTILVGCNGAGKTTLIMNIKEYCKENKIPCISYDNLHDGGHHSLSNMFYFGNYAEGALLMSSSEGECVKLNASRFLNSLGDFVKDGFKESFESGFLKAMFDYDESKELNKDVRVILLDALDSGLSVDSLVELDEALIAFNSDLQKTGLEYYLIVTANEYELSANHRCLDVESGELRYFNNYNQYRKFILSSRKRKEKRLDRIDAYIKKQKIKEYKKYLQVKKNVEIKESKILSKYPHGTSVNDMKDYDRYDVERIQDELTQYINYTAKYLTKQDIESFSASENLI